MLRFQLSGRLRWHHLNNLMVMAVAQKIRMRSWYLLLQQIPQALPD
jgi:hypothetical protein